MCPRCRAYDRADCKCTFRSCTKREEPTEMRRLRRHERVPIKCVWSMEEASGYMSVSRKPNRSTSQNKKTEKYDEVIKQSRYTKETLTSWSLLLRDSYLRNRSERIRRRNKSGYGASSLPHKRLTEPRHERKCVITAQITMPYASCVPRYNCRELAVDRWTARGEMSAVYIYPTSRGLVATNIVTLRPYFSERKLHGGFGRAKRCWREIVFADSEIGLFQLLPRLLL